MSSMRTIQAAQRRVGTVGMRALTMTPLINYSDILNYRELDDVGVAKINYVIKTRAFAMRCRI